MILSKPILQEHESKAYEVVETLLDFKKLLPTYECGSEKSMRGGVTL